MEDLFALLVDEVAILQQETLLVDRSGFGVKVAFAVSDAVV